MKTIKNERGQSLVELSIHLVLLLLLLSGAVEFGMAFFQFVQLRDAAQEGALFGSMNPSDIVNIEKRVRGSSDSPVKLSDTSQVTVAISIDGVDHSSNPAGYGNLDCEGHGLQVKVSFDHKIFMPFIPAIIGDTKIPLHASVTDTILSPVTC